MSKDIATLEGGDKLVKELLAVSANAKKSVKGINRAGTNVIKKQANANAKMLTGRSGQPIKDVRASQPVKQAVRLRSGFVVGSVVPAKGFGFLKFFEYGTKSGWRWARKGKPFTFFAGNKLIVTRLIKHPGMAKKPWLSPAIESSKDAAIAKVGDALRDAVEKLKATPEGTDG